MKAEGALLVGAAVGAGLLAAGAGLALAIARPGWWRRPKAVAPPSPPPLWEREQRAAQERFWYEQGRQQGRDQALAQGASERYASAPQGPTTYEDLLERAKAGLRETTNAEDLLLGRIARPPRDPGAPGAGEYLPGESEGTPPWVTAPPQ